MCWLSFCWMFISSIIWKAWLACPALAYRKDVVAFSTGQWSWKRSLILLWCACTIHSICVNTWPTGRALRLWLLKTNKLNLTPFSGHCRTITLTAFVTWVVYYGHWDGKLSLQSVFSVCLSRLLVKCGTKLCQVQCATSKCLQPGMCEIKAI